MIHRSKPRPIGLPTASVFAIALAALLTAALFPIFPGQLNIHSGDIASRTLRSPKSVSFESGVLTNQRKAEAENAVPPTLVFDRNVQQTKIADYDRVTTQIAQIRGQPTDPARKRQSLAQLGLSARSVETALALPDERWLAALAEGRRVLSATLNTSLDDSAASAARYSVDATISAEFTADEAVLTAEVVRPLIVPTLVPDKDKTDQARAAARAAVPAERINIEKNDVILDAGSRVDDVAVEKLHAAGVLSRRVDWRKVVAVALLSAIAAAAIAGYLLVMQPGGVTSERHMIALAVITAAPLLVAKFYLPLVLPDDQRHFLAFMLPIAAAPILIAALLETEVAVVVAGIIGVLVAFISIFLPDVSLVTAISSTDTMRLLLVYALGPIAGVFLVHRADRLNRYLSAGIAVAGISFLA